jgi:hypothetical protein
MDALQPLMWAATLIPPGLPEPWQEVAEACVEWHLAQESPRLAKHWGMDRVWGRQSWLAEQHEALDKGPLDFPVAHYMRLLEQKAPRRRGLRLYRVLNAVQVGEEIGLTRIKELFPVGPCWDRWKASSWMRLVGVKSGHFELVRRGTNIRGRSVEPVWRRVR